MARVTVEDCLAQVRNRFALTVLASRRARDLCESRGTPMVECNNKQAVTALREIADKRVRYVEDVEQVMNTYISEQLAQLRTGTTDNAFLEAASFGPQETDSEDEESDIGVAELTSDLTTLSPTGENNETSDDGDSGEEEGEKEETTEGGGDATELGGETAGTEEIGFDDNEAAALNLTDDDGDDDDDDDDDDEPEAAAP